MGKKPPQIFLIQLKMNENDGCHELLKVKILGYSWFIVYSS